MRKFNGSNVIIGFQPILCSHYSACAQEMDQNIINKNPANLRFKMEYLCKYKKLKKNVINDILVSITSHGTI